jgi:mannose-6-phosphate isomerase
MVELYPLKFRPVYKEKIWGGHKINTILGKDFGALPNCGESWVISGYDGNISEVDGGLLDGWSLTALMQVYRDNLLGKSVFEKFWDRFPLLIKFIDANDDLSVQVHPNDALAEKRHDSFGKTEMWFIIQADEGAKLISGFNKPLDKNGYLEAFKSGRLFEILNQEDVFAEDMFFMPAGRVHNIGKGILLAEIQQTSDLTYRIYDFERVDSEGNKRKLHVDEAMEAIDYTYYGQYKTPYENKVNEPVDLAKCKYFQTRKLQLDKPLERDYSSLDSFVIYVCYQGAFEIRYNGKSFGFGKGEAILLPSAIKKVTVVPDKEARILETFVPGIEQ